MAQKPPTTSEWPPRYFVVEWTHDVGAEVERVLEVRGGEGVVDDEDRADGVRGVGGGADVDQVQHRVRRGLDPDHPRVLVEPVGEIRELGRRHVVEEVALRLVDLRGHPVDAAVDVRDQDDALARVDEVHQRRRRAEPGGERDPCSAFSSDASATCSAVRVGFATRA